MNHHNTMYDIMFQNFFLLFFGPGMDWKWMKAQAIAESALNPQAVSPVGAMGIMQIMPPTWEEIREALNLDDEPFIPHLNIKAGIYYNKRLYRVWKAETGIERLRFTFASYNAGLGNIIKAQRLADQSDIWASLALVLPRVTGRHAVETVNYIKRIEQIYREEL